MPREWCTRYEKASAPLGAPSTFVGQALKMGRTSEGGGRLFGRSLTQNAAYRLSGLAASIGLTLVTTPLFLQGFGLDGFGAWSIAIAALGLTGVLDLGLGVAVVHLVARSATDPNERAVRVVGQAALLSLLSLGALGAAALWAGAGVLISFVQIGQVTLESFRATLLVAAIGVVPVFARIWGVSVFGAFERYGTSTLLQLIPAVVGMGGASVGAYLGWKLEQAMVWNVAIVTVSAAASTVLAVRVLGWGPEWVSKPNRSALKALFTYGTVAGVGSLAARVFNLLDRIVVGIVLGAGSAGVYTAAVGVANKINSVAQNASQVLLPRVSALAKAGKLADVAELFLLSHRLLASIAMLLGLTLARFAEILLTLWLGPEMAEITTTPLTILVVIYSFVGSAVPSMHVLNGLGRPSVYSVLMSTGAAISLLLLIGVGPNGVSWAAAANAGALVLLGMPVIASRLLGVRINSLLRWYGLPLAAGVLGYAGVVADSYLLLVLTSCYLGVVAWSAFLRLRKIDIRSVTGVAS